MIITGFLPKVMADKTVKSGDVTDFKESGKLNFSMAGTVTGVQRQVYPGGQVTYSFNGMTTTIRVNGSVDPRSSRGAGGFEKGGRFQAEIREARGRPDTKGAVERGESANSASPKEKQRIIIDYLQKCSGS